MLLSWILHKLETLTGSAFTLAVTYSLADSFT